MLNRSLVKFARLATLSLVFWAAQAQAILTIKITQGADKALPIAVVPFKTTAQVPVDVSEVVASDLARSGRFAPMATQDMVSRPSEFSDVNFQDWRKLSMENLVIGTVTLTPAGTYDVEFRLIDVYRATQLTGFKINSSAGNLRLTAHQISGRFRYLF